MTNIKDMNAKEKLHFESIATVMLNPKKMHVKPDFRYIMCEKFPDENLNNQEHDAFFSKYADRKVIVINEREDDDYFILEDNNYALTKECFY